MTAFRQIDWETLEGLPDFTPGNHVDARSPLERWWPRRLAGCRSDRIHALSDSIGRGPGSLHPRPPRHRSAGPHLFQTGRRRPRRPHRHASLREDDRSRTSCHRGLFFPHGRLRSRRRVHAAGRSTTVQHAVSACRSMNVPSGSLPQPGRTVDERRGRPAGKDTIEVRLRSQVGQNALERCLRTIEDFHAVAIRCRHPTLGRCQQRKRHRQGADGHHDEQHDDERDAVFSSGLWAFGSGLWAVGSGHSIAAQRPRFRLRGVTSS